MAELNPIIHVPARLQMMALLAVVTEAEFATVRDRTAVSDSVLSKHVAQLAEAGFVKIRKAALGGRQRTWLSLTREGRAAFAGHMEALEDLVSAAQKAAE